MSAITCHVLDSSIGQPAQDVDVLLQSLDIEDDLEISSVMAVDTTDQDGRCSSLHLPHDAKLKQGEKYRLTFMTKKYFQSTGRTCFYPQVEITFEIGDPDEHYHIPLLISPFGYTTYRGR